MDEQEQLIRTFKEITNSNQSDHYIRQMLEAHDWNVEEAVSTALALTEGSPASPPASTIDQASESTLRQRPTARSASEPQEQSTDTEQQDEEEVESRPAFSFLSSLFGSGELDNPDQTAEKFVASFDRDYGERHPRFLPMRYKAAVQFADRNSKLLLVYLHAGMHQDSDKFVQSTLCDESLQLFCDENVSMWAASIESVDGYQLSEQLRATTYPFVAGLVCSSNAVRVVLKLQGFISPESMISKITTALELTQRTLETARRERSELDAASLLRQEQDREYEESLERDRKREADEIEQRRREEERRLKQEQEAAEAERAAIAKEKEREASIAAKRLSIADCPDKSQPDTACLRLQLHDGSRLERCFYGDDTLRKVRDYVDVELYDRNMSIVNYELATNFPRRVYADDEEDMTLKEANLFPRALLYVQDLDS